VPELLSNAFSLRTLEGVNGHNIRQITGWDYGFGATYCPGYEWLDNQHLLLHPTTGQIQGMGWAGESISHRPVVIDLEGGHTWLPKPAYWMYGGYCSSVYWSRELGILISPGLLGSSLSPSDKDAVLTSTFDGGDIAYYWGKLLGVSPSRTKILVADDTIIDLRSDRIIELAWYMNYDEERSSQLYWTSDESRVYRCCYYYADTATGKSYSFEISELRGIDGTPGPTSLLPHAWGQWVRNDTYFLIEWSWIDDGDVRYLPMFDPLQKIVYDVREKAGISEEMGCPETNVSPDGMYLWIECWEGNHLVNLVTFDSLAYPDYRVDDFYWSPDSKFAWLSSSGSGNTSASTEFHILSVFGKEPKPFPVIPVYGSLEWHPTDPMISYLSEKRNSLVLLNPQTMVVQNLALPFTGQTLVWSPSGQQLALVAEDGSLWQVDYPGLEQLEQLTMPLTRVSNVNWSPDGGSIAFVSGPDIYIVETAK
jgi:hypothetical protein